MIRTTLRWTLPLFLSALAVAVFAPRAVADPQCSVGEQRCGNACYRPLAGQSCNAGVVCLAGQKACGTGCYTPARGEKCELPEEATEDGETPAESAHPDQAQDEGVPCAPHLPHCGKKCFNPQAGQTCNGGVLCSRDHRRCGSGCYNPKKGETCKGGLVHGSGEKVH